MSNDYLEPLWEAFTSFAELPAVVDRGGKRTTTYAELGLQAGRTAAWLAERGIAPGAFIPIVAPASMEYIAAELGIWMAGHACVPLGPAHPQERVDYIRAHCEAPLVIDAEALAEIAAVDPGDFTRTAPAFPANEQDALIIYTSGSTGAPKGVLHTFESLAAGHASLVEPQYAPDDAWGMGAPPYFIVSFIGFEALKCGAQLHLYDSETYRDMRLLEDYIADQGITYTFLSPSMLESFNNRSDKLKAVFTGSERVTGQGSRDGYVLLNGYGMSETMRAAIAFRVDAPYDNAPVGTPEGEWALLDDDGGPVPDGAEGELCLRGTFCKGYFKDPERTAELYRGGWLHTGDLMRQLPDGNLVYVNRKDWMAKVNGQRVEPGEVESAMRRVPGVKQAVVKAFDADGGGQYLCGYFTGSADADAVRDELSAALPPYMVPAYVLNVPAFAKLANGKVNRKVLAAPDAAELRSDYAAPATDDERALCDAFAQIFGLERVGVNDDFFQLGGDSIRVMKLQALCEGLPISTKDVARGRTPRGIAEALASGARAAEGAGASAKAPARAPLTQTQLGIYAESMAHVGEPSYNNPLLFKLDGAIDADRLARAIEAVVEAHPFVKLHIEEEADGTPVMVPGDWAYRQSVEEVDAAAFEELKPQLIEPFNLHVGPLFRMRVIKAPAGLFLFTDFHHVIYDGASMRIIMDDLARAYAGEALEPETYTGFDVALEEAKARKEPAYDEARQWYEGVFAGLELDCAPLPDMKPEAGADAQAAPAFATLEMPVGTDARAAARFCERAGVTPNVLAIGAFAKLLGAFANTDEALFATIYNGRADMRQARTVDMMVKTLPVYCSWKADTRVGDFLQAVKQRVMGAMAHDLYSFAEVASTCDVTSDVLFSYQGDYLALDEICGAPCERVALASNATGSALDFQLFTGADGLFLRVEYRADKYSSAFVADMARTYGCILRGLMGCERLADIALADDAQLVELDAFNATEVPYDQSQTVVSLFRSAAAAYPGNTAVVYEDDSLTYAELDELTDRLAAHIASLGLGAGDVVSALVPRGLLMPIAALGALKAGCAYQPLDPTYPTERLNFMVADASAGLLITTDELRPLITDYDGEVLESEPKGSIPFGSLSSPRPEDLFVLLYTSGTTGVPKGVRLTHRNLVCFINWYQRFYGLGPAHRVGAYASYGFDACMMDMYPALTCGAAVVIVPEEMRLDLVAMGAYLEANGVTHAFMTTQVGRQFAIDGQCATLEHLSMGGEALVPFDPPACPRCYNVYGPSECTILVTAHELQRGEADLPIGGVLSNVKGYVVSLDGKRVPVGAAGELWLAGPQVGDGYLNRPDKTAEAFGANPFDDDDYLPLYRTGDVVRYRRDGEIEFIGRRDGQVKVRGFRIELTEVEAVVREFPGITDATVAAFDHPSGGKYVAAYVVADETVDEAALGDFIRERKPPYMVPAALVQVDAIPLNQNGKVNRRALPEPVLASASAGEDDASRALNALERELLGIAEDVIGTSGFGVTAPLVSCGLTSISSLRLLAVVFKRFGVSISAKELDDDVSVETLENIILSEWMAHGANGAPGDAKAAGTAGEAAGNDAGEFRAPLTFAQMGVYYTCCKEPDSLAYNIPARFDFDDSIDPDRLADAVGSVVSVHPTLSACFQQDGDEIALVASDHDVEIERRDLTEGELDAFAHEFVRPFDLSQGPLARFAIVETPERTCLFADFHHLAFDGASMGVFMGGLRSALDGQAVTPEDFSYSGHAREEAAFAQSEGFKENERYLADLLAEFETSSEVPADLQGVKRQGKRKVAAAPIDLAAIERYCQGAGVTPAGFMLAAATYALSRYVNERRVYLATISNGRDDVRTANTVGMFVNVLPLSVEVADESAGEHVLRCARALADAIAHERYPFAHVNADYGFEQHIVYEYQIGATGDLNMPGLTGVRGLESDAAKFKLAVHIEPVDGVPCVALHYDDAIYSAELMEGVARSIVIAAEALLAQPDAPVRRIALLDDARRAQLERFHEVASGPIPFETYHAGLELQAHERPDARALVAVDGTFTFAKLNAWSNRIAHALMQRGIPQRSRIALLLPRTARAIMAMFGVMKAGCAYIPCDPTYPAERVRHILEDSAAPLVITTADRMDGYANAVDVEELLADEREDNPGLDVSPDDLAYLIYTSGSTGKPKGVMLAHRGVANYHANHPANILAHALVNEAHAIVSVTTLSFDMSVKEIGLPLVNGLAVVLADEAQANDPAKLAELFAETGADAFNATPSRLKQYLESPAFAEAIGSCKVVMSGGEKYTEGLLPLLRRTTHARIFNTYGPTEITVSSNMTDLTHADRITVGRPLYNVWECIVDADGNELPAGIVGELLIGGMGVAKGYNNLPEKTAEAFIEWNGRAMYRSGDYARWTAAGDVEILGRTDNQIKLRGLRIEIGEVESALASADGVTNAIVKIDTIGGVEHLCAYYTATRPLDVDVLRDELGTTLAKYMVPTAYLQLDALPLTPNGKVDIKGLPCAVLAGTGDIVVAETPVEQTFCDIFADILGLAEVGATSSFFDIGGTSLMAIRITVEAEKEGFAVTYSDVFANPTPRSLAALVEQQETAGDEDQPAERDAEVEDFDYTAVNGVLTANNLESFTEGSRRPLGNMLLTGAVGYLGIHILHEYLENHTGIAYCLLRGHGALSAEQRLKHQLFYYFERDYAELFGSRIIVVEGDVTRDLPLGADARIDTVVNCAAVVKHFSSGTEIEDVNVGGVRNLVEFCLARAVPLVQVSTGSTVKSALKPDASVMGKVGERQLYIGQSLDNKYVRSKFLAERLVLEAVATRGLAAKVMRVGNLAPRTTDGEFQINYGTNASMGRLKSFALLGCAPFDQLDATMEFSPIDETARAILLLAQTPAPCVLFHPFNHHAVLMGDVFSAMADCGLDVRPVERDEFARALRAAEDDPEMARVLTSMLAYAKGGGAKPPVVPSAGNAYTMQVLYRMGFSWTATSPDYIQQFLETLQGFGFFDLEG